MEMNTVAATQSMAARTTTLEYQPSQRALAARSWNAVERLSGTERAEATARHFEQFPPAIGSICRR